MQSTPLLERYYLEKFILEVSIATLEYGGVTSNLRTYQFLEPIDAWALPRYPEKTLILQPGTDISANLRGFIHTNVSHLHAPGSWLGTWINPATRCCHLDITEIYPSLEEARTQALQRNASGSRAIVAVYNFKQQKTIYLREEPERVTSSYANQPAPL